MTIVHIGARSGQDAEVYRAYGAGHVIFVEPDPDRIEAIRARCAEVSAAPRHRICDWLRLPETRFTVLEALVGDTDGKDVRVRRIDDGGDSGSVFRRLDRPEERPGSRQDSGDALTVRMRRLDTLLSEADIAPGSVDALVLDVTGSELLCLRGAPQTLRAARVLEVEIANTAWSEGGLLRDELEPWLIERGFSRATPLPFRWRFRQVVFVRKG